MWLSGPFTHQHTDSHPCTRPGWPHNLSEWSCSLSIGKRQENPIWRDRPIKRNDSLESLGSPREIWIWVVRHFYCKLHGKSGPKAPYSYSASVRISKLSISILENLKTINFMLLRFGACLWLPKPIIFSFGDTKRLHMF